MSNGSCLDVSNLITDHIPPLLTPQSSIHDVNYQRAIEIVQKAIDEDTNQNYAQAFKLYQNALDYFMLALKCAYRPIPMLTGPTR